MNILADANIPGLKAAFPLPFCLTTYTNAQEIPKLLANQDVLLCRSTLQVNKALLDHAKIRYVATASSGSDHLDLNYLQSRHIQAFDARGSNAEAVGDYVISCLAYLHKLKIQPGKLAGIIGMGFVGTNVYKRLKSLGYDIITYDPPRAKIDQHFISHKLEELYSCDILFIHAKLHSSSDHPSVNLINHLFLKHLKPGCIIINAARGGIVNEEALLTSAKEIVYCTDVYWNEPKANPDIINIATLCTPHIAGHSIDAKYRAVSQISEQLHGILQIPMPDLAIPTAGRIITGDEFEHWEDLALNLYNPSVETEELKTAENKESTFLKLRKAHTQRHDFRNYFRDGLKEPWHIIFGSLA